MKISSLPESMTILINFNDKKISINVKRFKKLNYIKEKVYQLFYPLKYDIKLKYNNKDLTLFLDQSIGLIFENRAKVNLQVEQILGTKRQMLKKIKLNSQKNIFTNKSEISFQSSQKSDRYASIQTNIPRNNINCNSLSPIVSTNIKRKLPPIKNKNLISYKNLENNEDKKYKLKINNSSYKVCTDCSINQTKFYCRKCNLFICEKCINKNHKNHLKMEIDINNEKENLNKYKEEINNKLSSAINYFDDIDNIKNNDINIDEWNTKYNDAINNLVQIAQEQKQEIEKNNSDNNSNNNYQIEFQNKLNEEIKTLNNITISITKDPFQLFNEINERDKVIEQTIKNGENKTNKIEEMFVNIENEIDNILFDLEEQINKK